MTEWITPQTRVEYGGFEYPAQWMRVGPVESDQEDTIYDIVVLVEKGELSAQAAANQIEDVTKREMNVIGKAQVWAAMYGHGYQYEQAEAEEELYRAIVKMEQRDFSFGDDDVEEIP